jgi:hypothetical protein
MKITFSSSRHTRLLLVGVLVLPLSLSALLQEELSQLIHDAKKVYLNHKALNSNQIEQIHTTVSSVIDAVTSGKLTIDIQTVLTGTMRDLSFDQDNELPRAQTLKIREKLYALESAKFFEDVEFKDEVTFEDKVKFKKNVVIGGTLTVADAIIDCDLTVGCNINMNDSISPAIGNILKDGNPFIHNFGSDNTFVGMNAGNFTMSGDSNTGFGTFTLTSNASGVLNTASGVVALASNTTGSVNTAYGSIALVSNISGVANTAIGFISMPSNISGSGNTAVGIASLTNNTFGDDNTAIGAGALSTNTTGSGNVALGINAGNALATGDNNIYIANAGIASESGIIRIGTNGTHAAAFMAGVRGVTTGVADAITVLIDSNGQLGTISSSRRFKHNIQDMNTDSANIYQLHPVTFAYNGDASEAKQYGLIAEEVDAIFPEIVAHDADGQPYTVQYHVLPVLLLNEVQKQQAWIKDLAARVAVLEKYAPAA